MEEIEGQIKNEVNKVTPLREKNIENLSRIQRLNLELQSLDEENTRIQDEIKNIKKSLQTFDEDISFDQEGALIKYAKIHYVVVTKGNKITKSQALSI